MDVQKLTAPCGLACFACAVYKDNITEEVAAGISGMLGLQQENVSCDGCRSERGCSVAEVFTGENGCVTKNCVGNKGLHNCSECDEFPCKNLMPVADGADRFPHNTKVYNLSRIKLIGVEEWAKESAMIQQKYFKGKFVYGQGPIVDGDA